LYKSQKQKVVTRSSTEAELVCLYSGVDLTLCYRRICQFMGIPDHAPLPVYQDNTSSIKIATKFYQQHQVHGFEVSMVEAAH